MTDRRSRKTGTVKKNGNNRSRTRAKSPQDYRIYVLTPKERRKIILLYLILDAGIALLFYRSMIAFLLFLPGFFLFLREQKKLLIRKRSSQILIEFTTGMQLVNASLQAGYAIENAFREAIPQLQKIYPDDSFILREFRYILSQSALNVPIETLLLDLGKRTQIEDIRNLAEIFQTAKRTGGDMIGIIRGAVTSIQAKTETREEIEANLSGKASEQKIMSAAPLFLIAYMSITSPGFLDVCYETTLGVLVMTGCLILYAAAFLWGRKIMTIEV